MLEGKEILAITTVRGGSKGLPRKNVNLLLGKPLMTWTIEHAKQSEYITRYVISTEDQEMKDVAKKHNVEVLDRPRELARDDTTTWAVLYHSLKQLKPYNPDAIVLLPATSPVRIPGRIDECIEEFFKQDVDVLTTGYVSKEIEWGKPYKRRQEMKGTKVVDGNVYVFSPETIYGGDLIGKKQGIVLTTREEQVDIDEEFDFWLAEKILEERM